MIANGTLTMTDGEWIEDSIIIVFGFFVAKPGRAFVQKRLVGTYLYFFEVGGVRHVHKHSYGIDGDDAQRRTLNATTWVRLAIGGLFKTSAIEYSTPFEGALQWIVRARGTNLLDLHSHRADGDYSILNISPWDALRIDELGSDAHSSISTLISAAEVEITRRRNRRLQELIWIVDMALASRKGGRESSAVKEIRELAERFLVQSMDKEIQFIRTYLETSTSRVSQAGRNRLLDLLNYDGNAPADGRVPMRDEEPTPAATPAPVTTNA